MFSDDTRSAPRELERMLRPFVARRVAARDVDDVVQDVFVRLQRALPELRDQDRFEPWLYRVARSAISENLRQRARHPMVPEAPEAKGDEPEPSETEALQSVMSAYAASLVALLPSPYREALTMADLGGATQEGAAESLGLSVSGMKSRVQRGRQRLRRLIEESCRVALDARGRVIDCAPRTSGCRCVEDAREGAAEAQALRAAPAIPSPTRR